MVNNSLAYTDSVLITKIVEKTGKRGPFLTFEAGDKWYTLFEAGAFANAREAHSMAVPVVIGYQPPTNAKFNPTAKEVNLTTAVPIVKGVKPAAPQQGIPKEKIMLASYVKDLIIAADVDLEAWGDVTDRIYDRLLNGKQEIPPEEVPF